MKMAALSATSGVAIPTIKYYVRERMLAGGERSASNQADYTEKHVERLRLIRALLEVGGLSIASAKNVIAAIDSDLDLPHVFEIAQAAVSTGADEITPESLASIDAVMKGWHVHPENPGRMTAARVFETHGAVGQTDTHGWFERYAQAALLAAEADVDELDAAVGRDAKAETVVVGTVLGDALFSGLRRAAQEHIASQRYSQRYSGGTQ